jgi:hypothetical protein
MPAPEHRPTAARAVKSPASPRAPMSSYVALVMALVPCCPFVSLAGGFLGLIVLLRLQKAGAGPNAPGRRVALAAAILGLLVAIGSAGAFSLWQYRMHTSLRDEAANDLDQFIRAVMDEDSAKARSIWLASPDAPPNDEFVEFGRTLQDRYGRFQRFAIDSFVFGGAPLAPTVDMSGVFTFETREVAGSARLLMRQSGGPFTIDLVLLRVFIEDSTLGDLVISD